ncbi:MAG: ribosomal protein S18-alanine N-acetyltransferase [Chloroflexi bacterium]|nr:ribosomal protein S18-alanine N-acetyltransferase [Chloroflexota bacterium]
MKIATRFLVRRMRLSDIPQVLEVERQSFPSMWPPTAFRRELQQNRLAHYIVIGEANPAVAAVASSDPPPEPGPISRFLGEIKHILTGDDPASLPPPEERAELITGFIGLWMLPDEVHIVTIAVRDSHRRQGIGEMLLIAALHLAREKIQPMVTLEVRVSNDAAIRLYEKYGFEQVGRRPRYYSDNHEDADILTANAVTTSDYADRFARLREEHRARYGEFDIREGD